MILICPSCDTRYTLSDAALGDTGRNVRCRACGHSWFAKPPQLLEAEARVQDDSGLTRAQVERLRQKAQSNAEGRTGPHAEIREKERKRRARNRMIAASGAWAASGLIFCSAATAAVVYREKVVEFWPKTASLYAMAGMEVNRFGLEFTDLEAQRSFDGTTPILTITGKVENVSESHRAAPLVRIKLTSETGSEVHIEEVSLYDSVVAPAAASGFSARIVSPPMDSYQLEVDFKDDPHGVKLSAISHDVHADDHAADHGDGHAVDSHGDDAHHEPQHDDAGHDASHDEGHGDAHADEASHDDGHH